MWRSIMVPEARLLRQFRYTLRSIRARKQRRRLIRLFEWTSPIASAQARGPWFSRRRVMNRKVPGIPADQERAGTRVKGVKDIRACVRACVRARTRGRRPIAVPPPPPLWSTLYRFDCRHETLLRIATRANHLQNGPVFSRPWSSK